MYVWDNPRDHRPYNPVGLYFIVLQDSTTGTYRTGAQMRALKAGLMWSNVPAVPATSALAESCCFNLITKTQSSSRIYTGWNLLREINIWKAIQMYVDFIT